MICVVTFNKETQKPEWLYLDFIEEGKGGQQDYHFVRSIWRFLLGKEDINFQFQTSTMEWLLSWSQCL